MTFEKENTWIKEKSLDHTYDSHNSNHVYMYL